MSPDAGRLWIAEQHRAAGRAADAAVAYRSVLAQDPSCVPALLALGSLHMASGETEMAVPLLERCGTLAPLDAHAQHALGLVLLLQGRPATAYPILARAHLLDPANALCAVNLADAACSAGNSVLCAAHFARARQKDPANVALLAACATLLCHEGEREEALDMLEAATLIDPQAAVPMTLYSEMLARTARQTEAEVALRAAMTLDPRNHDAAMALSVVLMRLHRYRESLDVLGNLQEQGVPPLGPLCNGVTALVALGETDKAIAQAEQAIAMAPDHPAPRRALCNALAYREDVTGAEMLKAAVACGANYMPETLLSEVHFVRPVRRRLRLALLSGTLRSHPVGWLTIAGFEALDPERYEIICCSSLRAQDPIGRRFAAIASDWQETDGLELAQLADRIRDLEIDILIDLGGYGDFGNLPVCAHRAAPVQMKWVGMQTHSTGMPGVDWFITDRWETPPGFEQFYSERLLRLPDGYVCYSPPVDAPPVSSSPAITNGYMTFGCFNNRAKINRSVVATWSRILGAIPQSRLRLATHQFNDSGCRNEIWAAFAAHGIVPSRVMLSGSAPHQTVLAAYGAVDIMLDPFPYSGGLTTCEALWMGVPTLTMPGQTFASRHSTSHMSNAGLSDWVVPDLDAYVGEAVRRAADPTCLASLRAGMRACVRASPLCDAPRFGRGLDEAFQHVWNDWRGSDQSTADLHSSL